MKRKVVPELLDTDAGTPAEIAASLADLRWLNRTFGGNATTAALLKSVVRKLGDPAQISYLDVAGASADGILSAQARLRSVRIAVTVLDRSPRHLARTGETAVCGDALALPFRDATYDVVGTSLFVHHLEPAEIIKFIREGMRVARQALLINDLIRTRLHYAAAAAGRMLYRSRLTRHDAVVSVQRAYTPRELKQIITAAGFTRIEISTHYFYRMGVIIWH